MTHVFLEQGDYGDVLKEMPLVDLIITSPPYNIGSRGKRQDGLRKLGKYDPKSFGAIRDYKDDMPESMRVRITVIYGFFKR